MAHTPGMCILFIVPCNSKYTSAFPVTFLLCLAMLSLPIVSSCRQEYCLYCKSGRQAGFEENCAACAECRVQPEAVCGCYYAYSRAQDDIAYLCVGENGLHRCQGRGAVKAGTWCWRLLMEGWNACYFCYLSAVYRNCYCYFVVARCAVYCHCYFYYS